MVNHGRRNGACSLCKARKVKCDETKPQCLRCQKYGRECPGIPEAKASTFRWRYRTYDPEEGTAGSAYGASTSPTVSSPPTGEVSRTFEAQAITLYLESLVKDNFFISYLPEIYNQCRKPSALSHSVLACATDWYARHEGLGNKYRLYSIHAHHKALHTLRTALADPQLAQQDETLASVLLIVTWESHICHEKIIQATEGHESHIVGALSMLRNRGHRQFKPPASLELFRHARNQMFMSVVFRPLGLHLLYAPGFDWFGDGDLDEPVQTKMNSLLIRTAWNVPLLRYRTAELLKTDPGAMATALSEAQLLLHQARCIEAALEQWKSQLPPEWLTNSMAYVPPPDDLDDVAHATAWPGFITTYDSILVAAVYNNFHILRLLVAVSSLQILEWLRFVPINQPFDIYTEQTKRHLQQQEIVDEICATIPFQTGEYPSDFTLPARPASNHPEPKARDFVGSYLAYFPLAVAQREALISPVQESWIREQMARIQRVYGSGLSSNLYSQVQPDAGSPGTTTTFGSMPSVSESPEMRHLDSDTKLTADDKYPGFPDWPL